MHNIYYATIISHPMGDTGRLLLGLFGAVGTYWRTHVVWHMVFSCCSVYGNTAPGRSTHSQSLGRISMTDVKKRTGTIPEAPYRRHLSFGALGLSTGIKEVDRLRDDVFETPRRYPQCPDPIRAPGHICRLCRRPRLDAQPAVVASGPGHRAHDGATTRLRQGII